MTRPKEEKKREKNDRQHWLKELDIVKKEVSKEKA